LEVSRSEVVCLKTLFLCFPVIPSHTSVEQENILRLRSILPSEFIMGLELNKPNRDVQHDKDDLSDTQLFRAKPGMNANTNGRYLENARKNQPGETGVTNQWGESNCRQKHNFPLRLSVSGRSWLKT